MESEQVCVGGCEGGAVDRGRDERLGRDVGVEREAGVHSVPPASAVDAAHGAGEGPGPSNEKTAGAADARAGRVRVWLCGPPRPQSRKAGGGPAAGADARAHREGRRARGLGAQGLRGVARLPVRRRLRDLRGPPFGVPLESHGARVAARRVSFGRRRRRVLPRPGLRAQEGRLRHRRPQDPAAPVRGSLLRRRQLHGQRQKGRAPPLPPHGRVPQKPRRSCPSALPRRRSSRRRRCGRAGRPHGPRLRRRQPRRRPSQRRLRCCSWSWRPRRRPLRRTSSRRRRRRRCRPRRRRRRRRRRGVTSERTHGLHSTFSFDASKQAE
mmetsp:Transcript_1242/g.3556  ORF Transcript_1242/g.3556 Transcript_1242/m.3556 type:complete len:324 (-) Transcript_1242:52-1023(-)